MCFDLEERGLAILAGEEPGAGERPSSKFVGEELIFSDVPRLDVAGEDSGVESDISEEPESIEALKEDVCESAEARFCVVFSFSSS